MRPRPQAAGLEISLYSGWTDEEGCDIHLQPGALHAVPATDAGMAAFAARLVAGGPASSYEGEDVLLQLPQMPGTGSTAWELVQVEMFAAEEVKASTVRDAWGGGTHTKLTFPFHGDNKAAAYSMVANASKLYARAQASLKERLAQLQKAAVAGKQPPPIPAGFSYNLRHLSQEERQRAACSPAPDPPELFGQRWKEGRDAADATLLAALTAVLQQALSFRGPIAHPAPPLPPAAEPEAQAAGQGPGGA